MNTRKILAIGALPFLAVADLLQNHINYLDNETRPKLIEDFKVMFFDFYYSKEELEVANKQAEAKRIHEERKANAHDVYEFNYRGHIMKMVVVKYGEIEDLPNNLLYDSQVIVHETDEGAKLRKCHLHDPEEASDIYRQYVAERENKVTAKRSAAQKLADRI